MSPDLEKKGTGSTAAATPASDDDAARLASWRRLAILLAVVLAVVVVGAGLGAVLLTDDDEGGGSSEPDDGSAALYAAGQDADEAARRIIEQMTTYDWRTVETDFDWVDTAGTEQFQEFFEGASEASQEAITTLKVTAQGEVVASAPQVEDTEHVTVLLFVDQTIKSARQKQSNVDQPRVTMDMVKVDGTWLADAVDIDNVVGRS